MKEEKISGQRLYTCGFYHVNYKKIMGFNKGNKLVINSFLKVIDQFGSFKANSLIHSDNGSEFKSYNYKLLMMMIDVKLSMFRVGRSTDNGYIKGF